MRSGELIAIAATIPTTIGGGNHGHAGIIIEPAKYLIMTGETVFAQPGNPGIYPAGLALNAAAGMRAREEALHKELIAQYEIHNPWFFKRNAKKHDRPFAKPRRST